MDNIPFEKLAVQFVCKTASLVPEQYRSLIFASPLSARTPDLCMLWHDNYREKHKIRLVIKLSLSLCLACMKGLVRLAGKFRPFGYALYGKINNTILVVTSTCGTESENSEFRTPYICSEKDDAMFVFGDLKHCGKNAIRPAELPFTGKVSLIYAFTKNGICSFFASRGNVFDKTLLLLQWLTWVFGLQWLYIYYLEKSLSKVIEQHNISNIGCIHELHDYARIVWRVAFKYKATGYTIQHAAITSGKRWYFSYPEEVEAGLMLPAVMYVYNKNIGERLKPFFKKTRFALGCSYRYAHWKDVKKNVNNKGEYYLFVGALAGFDNETLISSIQHLLLSAKNPLPIRLRLHPLAQISFTSMRWIRLNSEKGIINISKNVSLESDIKKAIAVIGMSTTVLEEALLMGRPVIQLTNTDYLKYIDIDGIRGVIKKNYRELSDKDLLDISDTDVDSESMEESLGLKQPLVNYQQLFAVLQKDECL